MDAFAFSHFDQFGEAIRDVNCRYTLTGREETAWTIGMVPVGRVTLQIARDGGPNVYEGATRDNIFIAFLPLGEPDRVSFFGRELQQTSLVALPPGRSSISVSKTANRWASVHIPVALLGGDGRFEEHEVAALLSSEGVLARAPERLARLRALVGRLAGAEESGAPGTSAVLQAQEDELIAALMLTLDLRTGARSPRPGRPAASRKRVLGAALGLIAASRGEVLYVDDLCHAAHVSERTLRNVFHESFGMGPIRYLRLQQLHRIRSTLRIADPERDTVTKIAAEFGIWDFSRLAREYRTLFGELPSQTLRGHDHSPD